MGHNPIYDPDDMERWELWVFRIIALAILALALALFFAGVVKAFMNTTGEAIPAAPPPDAIRTDVPTGRMVCEREREHGCVEWRIYRTVEH